MKRCLVLFTISLVIFSLVSCDSEQKTELTILFTSDMHGRVLLEHGRTTGSLAQVAFVVDEIRANEKNVFLLDGGDTIQGNPLMYYAAKSWNTTNNPIIEAMNTCEYTAMAVGNHEFNFGLDVLHDAEKEARFPFLSANIIDVESGEPAFKPYIVKKIDGFTVGIIGFTTENIPYYELPGHIAGLDFQRPVQAARKYVPIMKKDKRCDLIIALLHEGLPRENDATMYETDSEGNDALAIANMEDVDVLLMGHDHRLVEPGIVENTFCAASPAYAQGLMKISINISKKGTAVDKEYQGEWLRFEETTKSDQRIIDGAEDFYARTEDMLNTVISHCDVPFISEKARLTDDRTVDLLHQAQLSVTDAELSIASLLPWNGYELEAGDVTIRDMFRLYQYENVLMKIKMRGYQIKEFLEWSARYYSNGSVDENGVLNVTINDKISLYNVDNIEGLSYWVDIDEPEGERIRDIKYKGIALNEDAEFTVAVNSYRYSGGGGYRVLQKCIVLSLVGGARESLINYVRERGVNHVKVSDNWFLSVDGKKYEVQLTNEK